MVTFGATPQKTFKINKYICIKLEENRTEIYVDGKRFLTCKYLLLDIPLEEEYRTYSINSIDEAAESLDRRLEGIDPRNSCLSPETEFWGHCSNLQAWVEHNYNTTLLHRNLAFPLLKKLTDLGDPMAQRVFKEQIAVRLSTGVPSVIKYLMINGYLAYLTAEELESILLSNQNLEFWTMLANHSIRSGDFSSAIEILEKILKRYPTHLKILLQLGEIYVKIRRYNKALKIIKKALEIVPEEKKALNLLFEVYGLQGKYEKYIALLKHLLEKDPQNFSYRRKLAEVLFTQGKYEDAVHLFKEIYVSGEQSETCTLYLTLYYLKLRDFKRVCYFYQTNPRTFEVVNWFPQKISKRNYYTLLGDVYFSIGRFYENYEQVEKCIYFYKKAIKANPVYIEVLSSLRYKYPYLKNEEIINLDIYDTCLIEPEDELRDEEYQEYEYDFLVKNSKTRRRRIQKIKEKRKTNSYSS